MGTRRISFVADLISVIGFREKHFENIFQSISSSYFSHNFFDFFIYLEPILVILGREKKHLEYLYLNDEARFAETIAKKKRKEKNEETLEFVFPGSDAASERTLSSLFETSNLETEG